MTDMNTDTSNRAEPAAARSGRGSRAAGNESAEAADRGGKAAAGTSLDLAREAGERSFEPARRAQAAALEIQREATDCGREMVKASHRAVDETADILRQLFGPMTSLQLEMNRLMEDAWRMMTGYGGLGALRPVHPMSGAGVASLFGGPPVDLKESADAYRLCLEAPGLAREDLTVALRDGMMFISGQKSDTLTEGTEAYRISERRYGRFMRSFPIPPDVIEDRVEANLQNGVLTVVMPKAEEAVQASRTVEVKG